MNANPRINVRVLALASMLGVMGMGMMGALGQSAPAPPAPAPPTAPSAAAKPATIPIPEVASLKFQNLILRNALLQKQLDQIQQENNSLIVATCAGAGLAPQDCELDLNNGVIKKKEVAAPAPAPVKPPAEKPPVERPEKRK